MSVLHLTFGVSCAHVYLEHYIMIIKLVDLWSFIICNENENYELHVN